MTTPASEDLHLLQEALGGDRAAAETLVRRLMPVVRGRVLRALSRVRRRGGGPDVDDLVQEVWIALFADSGKKLLAFDAERAVSLEGYVGMLTERELVTSWRKRAAKKRGGHLVSVPMDEATPAPGPDPEAMITSRDLAARLGVHLSEALPDRGQLVLQYAFQDGRPAPEVAQILGVQVQVVYNWQHKIRSLAKRFLAG